MNPALLNHPDLLELRRVVTRIALKSQVSAAVGGTTPSTDEDIGGKRPTGGIDHKGDFQTDFKMKSAVYFQHRIERVKDEAQLANLLTEANDALNAWEKTPDQPTSQDPEPESFLWKCRIADDRRHVDAIVDEYGISRATVYRYRSQYRGVRQAVRGL